MASSESWPGVTGPSHAEPARDLGGVWLPRNLLLLLILLHVALWTLAPALTHRGLPLDVLEGYAVGREWQIGHLKHPSLPWWLLEASRLVTGTVGWPAYLLSAVAIAATYATVFEIGRLLLDEIRAIAGTLLLTAILFFSWVTPEFNHNVLQMPLWAGLILALLKARASGSTASWLAVGVLAAIGLYAKLSTGVLVVAGGIFILADGTLRRQLGGWRPWAGLLVFAVLVAPLGGWLWSSQMSAVDYARSRARAGGAGLFVVKLLALSLGAPALLLLALPRRGLRERLALGATTADRQALVTLGYFHFVPVLIAAAGSLVTGTGLKSAWGSAMLSLSGLFLVAVLPQAIDAKLLKRLAILAGCLLAALALAYGLSSATCDRSGRTAARVCWPERELARRLEAIWRERTGRSLRVVVGDTWTGAMVSVLGDERAALLFDGKLALSPSVTRDMIERHGALAVWGQSRESPPKALRWLIGERVDGVVTIPITRRYEGQIWYSVIPPGKLPPEPSGDTAR